MSKLAPGLKAELELWCTQATATGESTAMKTLASAVGTSPSSEKKRVVVGVTHEVNIEALREAGLYAGFNLNGMVSGSIAFEDLERLAAVSSVIYIEIIPKVYSTLDGTVF